MYTLHLKRNSHFINLLIISFVNWLEIGISPSCGYRIKQPTYIVQLIICICWLLGISLCVYRHWDQYLTVCHSLHDLHRSQEKVNITIMVIHRQESILNHKKQIFISLYRYIRNGNTNIVQIKNGPSYQDPNP